jgi:rhodanese-related sulfurtransferase
MLAPFLITPTDLYAALLSATPPVVLDTRRADLIVQSGRLIPTSRVADHADGSVLVGTLDRARPIVVSCLHGHNRSQRLVAYLRASGFHASALAGGYEAWSAARLPTIMRCVLDITFGEGPTTWVTRRRPKIDRVACPWLVRRYIDPDATFLFVEPDQVLAVAESEGAIAFDIPGAPLEHDGPLCTFDTMLAAFGLDRDPDLLTLAAIVRAADTGEFAGVPQAAGLLAISLGASVRHGDDDHGLIAEAGVFYDNLLAWIRHARGERHNWTPLSSATGSLAGVAK